MIQKNKFETIINVRLDETQIYEIDKIINKDQTRYANRSHFIRCAIIKQIREIKRGE